MSDSANNEKPLPPNQARTGARVTLDAEIIMRRAGKPNFRVSVNDLSPKGCKITFVDRPSLDARVWVRFEGLEALEGSVCWVKGIHAGVEFDRAIHPAVFDQLVQKLR